MALEDKTFSYQDLSPEEFRLLVVYPRTDRISCDIYHAFLKSNNMYVAIFYA